MIMVKRPIGHDALAMHPEAPSSANREEAIVYWPMASYQDVHNYKDPGEIPKNLARLGYSVKLVIGELHCDNVATEVLQTKNTRRFCLRDNVRELIFLIDAFRKSKAVSLFLSFNTAPTTLLSAAILKLRFIISRKKGRSRPYAILKLDSDGDIKRGGFLTFSYNVIALMLYSCFYDRIIVESTCAYEKIVKLPLPRERLKVVPNGYAEDLYCITEHDPIHRENVIISVSRISREKSIETLLRAFKTVLAAYPDWKLEIIGPIDDPGYLSHLIAVIQELGTFQKVKFSGKVDNQYLKAAYRRSMIFSISSSIEGYAISRIEATVNGLPVVTTNAGCPKDIEGFEVVNVGDVDALSCKLIELIENPGRRIDRVKEAQSNILSWKEVVERIISED